MNLRHFENKVRQSWWLVHIDAWRRSGVTRTEYCRKHRLTKGTFDRWLEYLLGTDAARKHAEYQAQLGREKRLAEREKRRKNGVRRHYAVSTDTRNRALQAFWAMHVEAMNWSGMSIGDYAGSLHLSPHTLRRWCFLLESGEVEIDWRAHLHPSARPVVSTSAIATTPEISYVNHPRDPGGATKYGIIAATLGASRRLDRKAMPDEVKRLTLAEAAQILDKQYAQPIRYQDLPAGLDYALFDYAVNSGPAQAVKTLQRVLGVEADGIMGAKTLDAIRRRDAAGLLGKLQDARLAFLRSLKTWSTFGKGWSARVAHVRLTAVKMAGGVSTVAPAPAGGQETANAKDTKVSATPAGKGTITATIGTAGAGIGAAKDSLSPLTGNGGFVDTVFTVLVVGGSLAAIVGLAVVAYQQMKHREAAA